MKLKLRLNFRQRICECKLNKSFFVAFALALTFSSSAYGNDNPNFPSINNAGSDNVNQNARPPHASAPFDAGLTLLIAAGIGYGVKRSYDKRKSVIRKSHDEPIY